MLLDLTPWSTYKPKFYAIFLFVLSCFLYMHTMSPGIYVGDSGEFISCAYTLGIAHPPGYPLYIVIGKIFSLVPLGSIAFRINLLSVFSASLSVVFLFVFLQQILKNNLFSLMGALIFLATRTFWSQATVAEVYSLNLVFIILLLICIYNNKLIPGFFLLGLSLTIHQTSLLLTPVLLFLFLKKIKNLDTKNKFVFSSKIFLFFLIGISLYIILLIRANKSPSINWGNPETFTKLFNHFLRKEYDPFPHVYTWIKTKSQIINYLKNLKDQFPVLLWLLILPGWWKLFKTQISWLIITIFIFIFTTLGIILPINYDVTPLNFYLAEVFFIPSYIIFLYWMLEGILFLNERLKFKEVLAAILICLIGFILYKNYYFNNVSKHYAAYYYGEDLLTTLPKGAYIIPKGDNQLFSLFYLKLVENRRRDLKIDSGSKKYIFENTSLKEQNKTFFAEKIDSIITSKSHIIPYGLIYTYSDDKKMISGINFWGYYKNKNLEQKNYYKDYLTEDILIKYSLQYAENLYAINKHAEAFNIFRKAIKYGADVNEIYFQFGIRLLSQKKFENAIDEFEKIINLYPENIKAYNYLGVSFAETKDFSNAIKYFKTAINKSPKNTMYLYNLALTYFRSNELNSCREIAKRIIDIDPKHYEAKKLLYITGK